MIKQAHFLVLSQAHLSEPEVTGRLPLVAAFIVSIPDASPLDPGEVELLNGDTEQKANFFEPYRKPQRGSKPGAPPTDAMQVVSRGRGACAKSVMGQNFRRGCGRFLLNVIGYRLAEMVQRGRKSAEATALLNGHGFALHPPASLGEAERKAFISIVTSVDRDHFIQCDLPLLCGYVESSVLAERAARELAKSPLKRSKPSPWLEIQSKAIGNMAVLAIRLALSPQARKARHAKRPAPPSYYDRMSTEHGDGHT